MPTLLSCPYRNSESKTPYKLVNGLGTAFEAGKKTNFENLPDGSSNTIGIIEDFANPMDWMKPDVFTAGQAAQAMNGITKATSAHTYETSFSKTYYGCNYVMVDCSSHNWPPQANPPMTPGAFLIADGELFEPDAQRQSLREIKYHVFIAPAVYLLLIFLPLFYLSKPIA